MTGCYRRIGRDCIFVGPRSTTASSPRLCVHCDCPESPRSTFTKDGRDVEALARLERSRLRRRAVELASLGPPRIAEALAETRAMTMAEAARRAGLEGVFDDEPVS